MESNKKNVAIVGSKIHVDILSKLVGNNKKYHIEKITYESNRRTRLYLSYIRLLYNIHKKKYDALHIFFPAHRSKLVLAKKAMKHNIRVIMHWIGSDILLAKKRDYFSKLRYIFNKSINIVTKHPWYLA